ncbi:MAG: sigma factor-like helix-turn-helix DNA-binding protein [Frankia sp.]
MASCATKHAGSHRTHAEIGRLLGVAAGTVKSRHHYAAQELRRALRDRSVTGT